MLRRPLYLCSVLVLFLFTAQAHGADQASLLGTGGLSLLPPAAAAPPVTALKVGFVDMAKVSAESAQGKAAREQVKGEQQKLQKKIDGRRKQIERFKAEVEQQLPGLSPQQREAKSREFQKKVEEFQKFGEKSEKELQALQEKLTRELLEVIGKAATELGRSRGLSAIVINRDLLYLDPSAQQLDLTADLLQALQGGKKK